MSFTHTVILGAISGLTIFLGLPVGRMKIVSNRARVCLAMFSVGILAFIFLDVLSNGHDIIVSAIHAYKAGHASFGRVAWLVTLLAIGFGVGCAGLASLEKSMRPAGPRTPPIAGGSGAVALPAGDLGKVEVDVEASRKRALRVGLTIAGAIGVHNFAEGLAIGVSARAGEISLATVLIIGFALHNATEGFGIVGPLGNVKPSWRWLALAGLIGGGPTFIGSMVGFAVTSQSLELAFYAMAGGAILYVIGEIWNGMRRYGYREIGLLMLTIGFVTGILTDLIITYGGG
jgi:ZIP family zinc transporter